MKIIRNIKENWITYVFVLLCFLLIIVLYGDFTKSARDILIKTLSDQVKSVLGLAIQNVFAQIIIWLSLFGGLITGKRSRLIETEFQRVRKTKNTLLHDEKISQEVKNETNGEGKKSNTSEEEEEKNKLENQSKAAQIIENNNSKLLRKTLELIQSANKRKTTLEKEEIERKINAYFNSKFWSEKMPKAFPKFIIMLALFGTIFGLIYSLSKLNAISSLTDVSIFEFQKKYISEIGAALNGMDTAFTTTLIGVFAGTVLSLLNLFLDSRKVSLTEEVSDLNHSLLFPIFNISENSPNLKKEDIKNIITNAYGMFDKFPNELKALLYEDLIRNITLKEEFNSVANNLLQSELKSLNLQRDRIKNEIEEAEKKTKRIIATAKAAATRSKNEATKLKEEAKKLKEEAENRIKAGIESERRKINQNFNRNIEQEVNRRVKEEIQNLDATRFIRSFIKMIKEMPKNEREKFLANLK